MGSFPKSAMAQCGFSVESIPQYLGLIPKSRNLIPRFLTAGHNLPGPQLWDDTCPVCPSQGVTPPTDTPLCPKARSCALPTPYKTSPPFMGNVLAWIRRHQQLSGNTGPCVCVPALLTCWQSCMLTVAPSLRWQLRRRRRSPCPQVALAPSWHLLQPADTKQRVHCCRSPSPSTQNHTITECLGRDLKDGVVPTPCRGRATFPQTRYLKAPSSLALTP